MDASVQMVAVVKQYGMKTALRYKAARDALELEWNKLKQVRVKEYPGIVGAWDESNPVEISELNKRFYVYFFLIGNLSLFFYNIST